MRLVKDDLMEKASDTGRQVARQAADAVETGKERARLSIEEKKGEAVSQVQDLDQALRQTARQVDNPGLGRQLERLADGIESFATTLESTELDDVLQESERMARQNPALFLGGSFAVGMLVARFLRSSSRRPSALASAPMPR